MSDDASDRLVQAITTLDQVASELTPDDAVNILDNTALQTFWREWPDIGSWAGAMWRRLNDELAEPAREQQDPVRDEVGGED
jgi:hypothetical protein